MLQWQRVQTEVASPLPQAVREGSSLWVGSGQAQLATCELFHLCGGLGPAGVGDVLSILLLQISPAASNTSWPHPSPAAQNEQAAARRGWCSRALCPAEPGAAPHSQELAKLAGRAGRMRLHLCCCGPLTPYQPWCSVSSALVPSHGTDSRAPCLPPGSLHQHGVHHAEARRGEGGALSGAD